MSSSHRPGRRSGPLGTGKSGSPNRPTDGAAQARLLSALRERAGSATGPAAGQADGKSTALCLVKSDAAVLTGLPADQAESALRDLARDYRSHLMVTEQGELVYQFAPGLVRRDLAPLSERFLDVMRPVGAALWRGFTVAFKVWIALTLVLYTTLFAVLGIALMLAGNGDDDGPSGLFLWFLPDFGGNPRRRRFAEIGEAPRKPFYRSVFDYVFGPDSARPRPGLAGGDDRLLLEYIRSQRGRISASDLVLMTGWSYRRADEEATRLLVQYDGEPEVADNGALVYTFRDLRRTAQDADDLPGSPSAQPAPALLDAERPLNQLGTSELNALIGRLNQPGNVVPFGQFFQMGRYGDPARPTPAPSVALAPPAVPALVEGTYAWEQAEPTPALTGNGSGTNLAISALNTFNLLAALTIGPIFALHYGLGVLAGLLLSIVPFVFSLVFFTVPLSRYIAERVRHPRRLRRNLRRALLWAISIRRGEAADPDELIHQAVCRVLRTEQRQGQRQRTEAATFNTEQRAAALLPVAREELQKLHGDLEGDVQLPGDADPAPARGALARYHFPRFKEEQQAAQAARDKADRSEEEIGEVIFSSASEGAGV